ncbi:unnamed protein product [Bursaphelenchus okinawaensis]|uniref:Protein kinase domain-containing protein n=1 Tax=Bursaphelenchus okinawaensis TaxID=465554 RepID=A0A811K383_9BILA|nr:unnamed protein product [Bursaphelenchus okinawaensis]CAG9091245.1 unnamed protein product [Bursaphelenchus okinawaensis]
MSRKKHGDYSVMPPGVSRKNLFQAIIATEAATYSKKQQDEAKKHNLGNDIVGVQYNFPIRTIVAERYHIVANLPGKKWQIKLCARDGNMQQLSFLKVPFHEDRFNMVWRELTIWSVLEDFEPLMFLNPPDIDLDLDCRTLSFPALGYSIYEIKEFYNVLPLQAIIVSAMDMLCAIKQLHDQGLVHRAISPHQFRVGLSAGGTDPNIVHLVSLEVAKTWININCLKFIPGCGNNFKPNELYSSPDVVAGKNCTRRDDLLSWFYCLLFMRKVDFFSGNDGGSISQVQKRNGDPFTLVAAFGARAGPPLVCILQYLRWLNPGARPDYIFIYKCLQLSLISISNRTPPLLPKNVNDYVKMYDETYDPEITKDMMEYRKHIIERQSVYFTPDDEDEMVDFSSVEEYLPHYAKRLSEFNSFSIFENMVNINPNIPFFVEYAFRQRPAPSA